MFYQLPNGKVIEMTTEQFVEMSDEELEYLIAYNYGDILENPWLGSVLNKHDTNMTEDIELPEITDITELEKLKDLDIDKYVED